MHSLICSSSPPERSHSISLPKKYFPTQPADPTKHIEPEQGNALLPMPSETSIAEYFRHISLPCDPMMV